MFSYGQRKRMRSEKKGEMYLWRKDWLLILGAKSWMLNILTKISPGGSKAVKIHHFRSIVCLVRACRQDVDTHRKYIELSHTYVFYFSPLVYNITAIITFACSYQLVNLFTIPLFLTSYKELQYFTIHLLFKIIDSL